MFSRSAGISVAEFLRRGSGGRLLDTSSASWALARGYDSHCARLDFACDTMTEERRASEPGSHRVRRATRECTFYVMPAGICRQRRETCPSQAITGSGAVIRQGGLQSMLGEQLVTYKRPLASLEYLIVGVAAVLHLHYTFVFNSSLFSSRPQPCRCRRIQRRSARLPTKLR